MAVSIVNAKADVLRAAAAFSANCNAAKGLQDVLKSNLGPKGTIKMLVGGAGQIKLTKDGCVLLHEMQIQHPTASMIARAATAQDEITGDGTTSNVLLIGEFLRQSEKLIFEGVHPRLLCAGIDLARTKALHILDEMKVHIDVEDKVDIEMLQNVCRTSLLTKLPLKIAETLTKEVTNAVLLVRETKKNDSSSPDMPIDLFRVEILHIKHKFADHTKLIRGMAMDHGCRHPDMPSRLENCYILICNVSLEYEKTEVNSGFFYSSAEQREKLVQAERKFTDDKVKKIIALKQKVCTPENRRNFVVLNQKGIDPPSLDLLAREGIMALRRVKRRNMERLALCCGGVSVNSVEDLSEDDLGFAGLVYEETYGDDKFTFVENVKNPQSCCILVKGPNDHTISQIKDAIRDGLRAVKNALEDKAVIPGAGAFEIVAYNKLQEYRKEVEGKVKLGIDIFMNALLVIPRTLADNSGFDIQDTIISLIDEYQKKKTPIGIDLTTGRPISPSLEGIWDNYRVKRQMLSIAPSLAQQLLLVDEVLKAGKSMNKQ